MRINTHRIFGLALALVLAAPARATVPSPTSTAGPYTCNGSTTAFSVPFRFLASTDLVVMRGDTTLALGADYTVTGAGSPSGTVTLTSGLKCSTGNTLTIKRTVPLTQTTPFSTQGSFSPKAHELAFDRQTMAAQQIDRRVAGAEATHAADKANQATRDLGQDVALSQARADFTAGSGGFGDATNILSEGSTVARPLQRRFSDEVNILDHGGHPVDENVCTVTGNAVGGSSPCTTLDNSAAVIRAVTAIGSTKSKVLVMPGRFYLAAGVTVPKNILVLFEGGWSGFIGPGAAGTYFQTPDGEYHVRRDYGAKGDNSVDDQPSIQNAVDAAYLLNGGPVVMDPGSYKILAPIDVKSNTEIRGTGRHFGATLLPVGTYAFRVEGTDKVGGWVFRIKIKDMLIQGTNASGPAIIALHYAYNVIVDNVFIYDTPVTGVSVSASNAFDINNTIVYCTSTSVPRGIFVDGTAGNIGRLTLQAPDVEACGTAIETAGEVQMDVISPYVERCTIAYKHQISAGKVNIFGGILGSTNGYGVKVLSDHLSVMGTDIDPYIGGTRGGLGIDASASTAYYDVHFCSIPRFTQADFTNEDTNWLTLDTECNAPRIANHYHRTISLEKSLPAGVATDLFVLDHIDTYARVKLTLGGPFGDGYMVKEFRWVALGNTGGSSVYSSDVVVQDGASWHTSLDVALVPGTGVVTVKATHSPTGGGAGQAMTAYGTLEIDALEANIGGIYLR